jgi:hypothetical protein
MHTLPAAWFHFILYSPEIYGKVEYMLWSISGLDLWRRIGAWKSLGAANG